MRATLFSLAPFAAAVLGGLVALYARKGRRFRSFAQHLAAGVITGAVALELIPELVRRGHPAAVALGYCAAVAVLVFMSRAEGAMMGSTSQRLPLGYVAAVGVDWFIDGFVIALGLLGGTKEGELLTLALAIEMISSGMATSSLLLGRQLQRFRVFLWNAGLGALLIAGAALGEYTIPLMPNELVSAALGFGTAAILFLVAEELLREAHEQKDTTIITTTFFAGFLLILVLHLVVL